MTKVETMLEAGKLQAKAAIIEGGGTLPPTWILVNDKGDIQIEATPWTDEFEKLLAKVYIRAHMLRQRTTAYAFLAESWRTKWDPGKAPPLVSNLKDRIECVMLFATDGKTKKWAALDIKRSPEGQAIALEPLKDSIDAADGWMVRMLEGGIPR
jgi:hypothetical protein